MGSPIYLDHAATTPVDPRVVAIMGECLGADGDFGNASSAHSHGRGARERVEVARGQVAALVGAEPTAIVFTSGATESDNLAVLGAARGNSDRGRHVVTSRTEHRAVLDACRRLEREGFEVTWLEPERAGQVAAARVIEALRPDTVLVSLMHANNETGVLNEVEAVGAACRDRRILFHVDAAQSVGKVPVDVDALGVDLLSFTAHKLYGPKGVGALYVRRRPRPTLVPLTFGGGHEGGLRPGTLPTHQVAGFGEACRLAREALAAEPARLGVLRQRLWQALEPLGGLLQNGAGAPRLPNILNVSFSGVEGESLLLDLDGTVSVSSGSACSSAAGEPSYVLRALGLTDVAAQSSLRMSLGRTSTRHDVEVAAAAIATAVRRLRALAPASALEAWP